MEAGCSCLCCFGWVVFRKCAGPTEASSPGAADGSGKEPEGVLRGVEAGVTVVGVTGPHALAVAVVVTSLVQGPS